MPLADDGRLISGLFQNRSNGFRSRLNDGGAIRRGDAGAGAAKRVVPRQQGVSGGCAGGCRTVSVGESQSAGCQAVDMWCLEFRGAVAGHVAVTHVVRHDDDNVRPLSRGGGVS